MRAVESQRWWMRMFAKVLRGVLGGGAEVLGLASVAVMSLAVGALGAMGLAMARTMVARHWGALAPMPLAVVALAAMPVAVVPRAFAAGPLPDVGVGGQGFAQVLGPRTFEFPQDHGPHPDYRQEWWYVTGNLDASDGERFGFELTFFRFGLERGTVADAPVSKAGRLDNSVADSPRVHAAGPDVVTNTAVGSAAEVNAGAVPTHESAWRTRQIYMAHFAITDVGRGRFRFAQKLSRDALGLAGARNPPLRVWIDDWSLATVAAGGEGAASGPRAAGGVGAAHGDGVADGGGVAGDERAANGEVHWRLRAAESGYELTLDARALLSPVLNGDGGFSRKSNEPGSASYYYSLPRVAVSGRLVRDGKPLEVHGLAWVDREWGSGALGRNEQGWDWFALQLSDGSALMFYALRHRDGGWDPNSAGTWVAPDGKSRPLSAGDVHIDVLGYWTNPRGERYPARWHVRVPTTGMDVEVRPVLADQELVTTTRYWEGAVDVAGASGGRSVGGRGYVELVGYAAQ